MRKLCTAKGEIYAPYEHRESSPRLIPIAKRRQEAIALKITINANGFFKKLKN